MRTSRKKSVCVVIGLACLTVGLPTAPASAAPPSAVASAIAYKAAALPTAVTAPPEGNGKAFHHNPIIDYSGKLQLPANYTEEELLVSGTADVYEHGADGDVRVKESDVPYTTRVLVRMPKDPGDFSGNVHLEAGPSGLDGLSRSADKVFADGDAWVTVLTHALSSSTQRMKTADPVRYDALSLPEFGQNWDILSQVGRLLKTRTADNPLNGYGVRKVYANGWAFAASVWLTYTGEGFHDRLRMPGGRPIFDGYLIGNAGDYQPVNSTAPAVAKDDPRQKVRDLDVPVVVLLTGPQDDNRRRPDGPGYRVYEVAGASTAAPRAARAYGQTPESFLTTGPFACDYDVSRFPFNQFFQSSLTRLENWSDKRETPPPSQQFERNADGTAKLDAYGIPLGGVRSTYTDLPTARYFANSTDQRYSICASAGAQEPLTQEQLKSLYGSKASYVKKVVREANRLERQGWLLPDDAREIRQEAKAVADF
ncbi:alpha/beta hydrolase domain-containing protein [Streptomyces geranii]|uniref:alpha/beta hydrolase domain-containing protein n=1 Tax=Streptomyces geranii TaxID=2058923 RepID=UPI0013009A3D|nr:alpha/beta hydrolase domain-containing protein [Streptomyces geranii]